MNSASELVSSCCGEGHTFVTGARLKCTVRLLENTKYKERLRACLLARYSEISSEDKEKMSKRVDEFSRFSYAFTMRSGSSEFGIICQMNHAKEQYKVLARELTQTINGLQHKHPYPRFLIYVFCGENVFSFNTEQGEAIIKAVEKGMPPSIAALVKQGRDEQNGGR